MSREPAAWLLSYETGSMTRLPIGETDSPRKLFEQTLHAAFVEVLSITPYLDIWRDPNENQQPEHFNGALAALLDRLIEAGCPLPRMRGDVIIASHNADSKPTGVSHQGLLQLREVFAIR